MFHKFLVMLFVIVTLSVSADDARHSSDAINFEIPIVSLFDKKKLKLIHLDLSVGRILVLLLIKIKKVFLTDSSRVFSKALIEFIFRYSILSTSEKSTPYPISSIAKLVK